MNNEKQISTIEDLALLVAQGFEQTATKEDVSELRSDITGLKSDVSGLKGDVRRIENKLDAVIDRTLPDHDRRITRVETTLKLPKLV